MQPTQKMAGELFLRDMKPRDPCDRYFMTRDMSRDRISTQ